MTAPVPAKQAAVLPAASGEDAPSSGRVYRALRGLLRSLRRRGAAEKLHETIERLIERHDRAPPEMTVHERIMLANLFKFRTLAAEDVAVPRADIVAVEQNATLEEIAAVMGAQQHSRLPVYRETLDDVVGMVHVKDVLACTVSARPFDLRSILRKVMFVAPSMRVLDLLLEMRRQRLHMALVVDEFGGADGLVTIEDLVEEIVGEIEDEHDVDEGPKLVAAPDGTVLADARARIEEFEAMVGPVLSAEERESIDTLAGLAVSLAGHVPSRGELLRHASGVEFEVLDADPRRVKRLKVRNLPKKPAPAR